MFYLFFWNIIICAGWQNDPNIFPTWVNSNQLAALQFVQSSSGSAQVLQWANQYPSQVLLVDHIHFMCVQSIDI